MSVNGSLQVTVLFTGLAANTGNHFQLLFGQIRTSLDHPRLAQVFTGFGIIRGDSQRTLVVTDTFIRTTQFAGGITPIVPGPTRIGLLSGIE